LSRPGPDRDSSGPESGVRRQLRSSVVESAAPYGYTLTIFGTGSVAEYMIGKPHVFEVLIYIAGAVAGFLAVAALAYGRPTIRLRKPQPGPEAIWGHAHLVSAGAAVGASWAFLQVLSTNVAWTIVGFLTTVVYLLLSAIQAALASAAVD
jgi:hypothetical protein